MELLEGPKSRTSEELVPLLLEKSYNLQSDLFFLPTSSFTHQAGRHIDRILHTTSLNGVFSSVSVLQSYYESDHFPVQANLKLRHEVTDDFSKSKPYLSWDKASEKALLSYSNLCEKTCSKSLNKFNRGEIDGPELYKEVVKNISTAASTCIPKVDPSKQPKRHSIPLWRERMSSYQTDVDYWVSVQHLHGGPARSSEAVKLQLRLAKSRYRRQIRQLRREVQRNIAESATLKNCHKKLFKKNKVPAPAMIDGYSKHSQPAMWREHFSV